MKTNHGFTLLELLIAIAITSVIMSTAIPGIHELLIQAEIESESSMVYRVLQSARLFAIENRKSITVCFIDVNGKCIESSGRSIAIFEDDNHDRRYNQTHDVMISQHTIQQSLLTASSNQAFYLFQPDGTTAGTMGTIQLCHAENKIQKSFIIALSGRVRMTSTTC